VKINNGGIGNQARKASAAEIWQSAALMASNERNVEKRINGENRGVWLA